MKIHVQDITEGWQFNRCLEMIEGHPAQQSALVRATELQIKYCVGVRPASAGTGWIAEVFGGVGRPDRAYSMAGGASPALAIVRAVIKLELGAEIVLDPLPVPGQ